MTDPQSTLAPDAPQGPIVYRIYTLAEPDTGVIRYVGITRGPLKQRRAHHICHARNSGEKNHRTLWLRSLEARGLRPVIAEVEATFDPARERFWIAHYRESGCDLVNASEGMESHIGYVAPSEVRAAISAAKRGKPISEAHRAALRKAITGRVVGEETREKHRVRNLGRVVSAETRRKIGSSSRGKTNWSKGRPKPQEQRDKIAATLRGRKSDPIANEKRRVAMQGRAMPTKGQPWSEARRAAYERSKGAQNAPQRRD